MSNRFIFGEHAVTNNTAAMVSPRQSSVARIRTSIIHGSGPESTDCAPRPRPAGTSTTIHEANVRRAAHHDAKAKRAQCMPKGPLAAHIVDHSPLQRAYMMSCSGHGGEFTHPDPLVLKSLEEAVMKVDVQLYEKEDLRAVEKLLAGQQVLKELEGICVSCGELRGASVANRRIGWEVSDVPRSVLVGGPESPTKARRRGTGGKCRTLLRNLSRCLMRCELLSTLEFIGINLTPSEIKILASGIKGNTVLSSFTMRRVLLGDDGAAEILPALATSQCEAITVSHANITDSSRTYISHLVKAHCCRRDEMTWAISLRGKVGMVPSTSTAPGEIPTSGVLCLDLSNNKLGDELAHSLSHALIHDGWLLALNLSSNRIGMAGATALCEMLVTNRYVAAIKMDGNPCVQNPKGKKGLKMMSSLLSKRNVNSKDGLWDGIYDLIEEWRDGDAVQDLDVTDLVDGDDGEDEDEGNQNESSFVIDGVNSGGYRVAVEKGDEIMSPSGLKFGEGFVDDDDEDGDDDIEVGAKKISGEEDDGALTLMDEEGAIDEKVADANVKSKKKRKKKIKKVKKGTKKKSSTGVSAKSGVLSKKKKKAPLNVNMSIPSVPPTQTRLTAKQREALRTKPRPQVPRRASPSLSPPPAFMALSEQEFEKALFGPGSKQKGISALVRSGSGGIASPNSPKRKAVKGKKKKDRGGGVGDFLLNGSVGSGVDEPIRSGQDSTVQLSDTIRQLNLDLNSLESKIRAKKAEHRKITRNGKKTKKKGSRDDEDFEDQLISEISAQVASRLNEMWK